MINSKKLAATPLTELELGSIDFCVALAVHVDQGEQLKDISVTLNMQPDKLTGLMTKGRLIRDRYIQAQADAYAKMAAEGTLAKPYVSKRTETSLKTFAERAVEHGAGLRLGKYAGPSLYYQ